MHILLRRVGFASKRCLMVYALLLAAIFFLVAAGKPVAIYSEIGDEPLFLRLGMSIASGQWLGAYNIDTLVKGAGYPIFLFVNYMSGLSIGISQLLLYLVAAIYLSHTLTRISSSYLIFVVLYPLLLTVPALYSQELQRLLRDEFYTAIVLLYFSAVLNLLLLGTDTQARWPNAVLAGVLAGILWITREEGAWIVPATLFVILAATVKKSGRGTYACLRIVGLELASAMAGMATVIIAIGVTDMYYYGSFTLNEIKSGSFQGALVALQKASAPYSRPYIPVPKAGRLKIYEQSPAFAELKSDLDPEGASSPWNDGCSVNQSLCGDIGGGWFIWAFREGAARAGYSKSPETEARFFGRIAQEVEDACSDARLTCGPWLPPLIPYVSLDQILSLPAHGAEALRCIAMLLPMSFEPLPSQMDANTREDVLTFLNHPVHVEGSPTVSVTLSGWYRGSGDEWISVAGSGVTAPPTVSRNASPDLVAHFFDPVLHDQRFTVQGACVEGEPCSISFTDARGKTLDLDPYKATAPGSYALGDGQLFLDSLQSHPTDAPTLRTRLYENWVVLVSSVWRPFSTMIIAGGVAFMAAILQAIYRRRMSRGLIAASTLVIAVLSRAGLLALIDVSSFSGIHYTYCMPAIPLAVAAAVLSIFEVVRSSLFEAKY